MIVKLGSLDLQNFAEYKYECVNSPCEPLIGFCYNRRKIYTTVIVDLNAVDVENIGQRYIFLHMIKINNSELVNEYLPPLPPIGSGVHKYSILLFEQTRFLQIEKQVRENFNLKEFMSKNGLVLVDYFIFKTSRYF